MNKFKIKNTYLSWHNKNEVKSSGIVKTGNAYFHEYIIVRYTYNKVVNQGQ